MFALQHQILSASSIIISILKEIKAGLKKSEDIGPTEYTSLLVPWRGGLDTDLSIIMCSVQYC